MQLKKQNWKKVRHLVPCALCGDTRAPHPANACPTRSRKGKKGKA